MTTMDYGQVVAGFRKIAEQRRTALQVWQEAIQLAADAEGEYRKAYAIAIVSEAGAVPVREALARAAVVKQLAARDVTKAMVDVAKERVRGLEGERANLNGLADWSKKIDHGVGG